MLAAFSPSPAYPQESEDITADQASQKKSDIDIMRDIRKAIVADETLSMTGKNIKVIAIDGRVTLRGAINAEEERSIIVGKAADVVGQDNVIDRLSLKSKNGKMMKSGGAGNANQ